MTPKCHVRFGERGRETRLVRARQVRSAPTPFSPLLLTVALHGMEHALGISYTPKGVRRGPYALVKYADDLAVFSPTHEGAVEARHRLSQWLGTRGLRLSDEKTQIRHLRDGVNFLGFNIRHYPTPNSARSGDKLLIKPSQDSIQ